jgi:DNA polymerase III sliding clamp (beta) subunit (PCNA family)
MKFTINTAKVNAILSAVAKGVGKKYTLPITEYLQIKLEQGMLQVTATDLTNFITYVDREVEGEEGEAIVKADTLIKLVSKTTKDKMTFTLKDGHLEVKGNGSYKIELLEEGEFPEYDFNDDAEENEIETATLKKMFGTNKSAIASELIMPCLTGYNVGAMAITTDGIKMCINDVEIAGENMLITQTLADLLTTLTAEKVVIQKDENKILFKTHNIIIFGTELDGIDEYPDITSILEIEYDNNVTVSKSALISAVDRLGLFVNSFDNNGIRLQFTAEALIIEDLKQNSQESIEYTEKHLEEDIEVILNIDLFRDLLTPLHQVNVKLEIGADLPIKIAEDKVTQIISTMEVE